jgi:hypothetical protein
MTGQYDPWTNARFGFPRKDAPAFQREWKPMNSSGVQLTTVNTDAQTVVKATSSVGASGTIYIWGMCLCTTSTNAQAIAVKDDEDNTITSMVATANGPYFLQLSTPIQVPINSKLRMERLTATGATADTYCTINYTSAQLNYEP